MFKNYLKIAIRNFRKQKLNAFINVAGLAVGMACCLLILLFVKDELSYDRFHEKSDRIYRVYMETAAPDVPVVARTQSVLALKLEESFPEIQEVVRLRMYGHPVVSHGEKQFKETRFFLADRSVFDIFSFRLIHGNESSALTEPNSVILTESTARRYFGDENPLQQQIEVLDRGRFTVTGVMADVPRQSHFHFDFLASYATIDSKRDPYRDWIFTYVLLSENVSPKMLEEKFTTIPENDENLEKSGLPGIKIRLQPITDIHLRSQFSWEIEANSDIRYVYIFSVVAALILLTACVNYMNMATARSTSRAREVGIRKAAGSLRRHLVVQFLGESVLLSSLAVGLALILVELCLPAFNSVVQKQLTVLYFQDVLLLPGCLGLALLTGVVSGSYPAIYLSAFMPVKALKGVPQQGRGAIGLRRVLVLLQFTVAVCLIAGTAVIQKQLDYIRNKKLGFDKENIIVLPLIGTEISKKHAAFKSELLQHPKILRATAAGGGPFDASGTTALENTRLQIAFVDADYMPALGIELVAGRNLSPEFAADSSAVLLNETAVSILGWENPLEESFTYSNGNEKYRVIGIVRDFHNRPLHAPIEPMVFQYPPRMFGDAFANILLKVSSEDLTATMDFIRQKWQQFEPVHPFEYSFLDEDFHRLYHAEQRMGKIFFAFSALTIFIASLGLLGLVSYAVTQRTKEIGVRKVFGATVANVTTLLSKDFVKLVLAANLIAWPVAWLAMNRWLQNFAYRIEISWWIFVLAGGLALLIALLTVSTQAIRAALANPVEALRYE